MLNELIFCAGLFLGEDFCSVVPAELAEETPIDTISHHTRARTIVRIDIRERPRVDYG